MYSSRHSLFTTKSGVSSPCCASTVTFSHKKEKRTYYLWDLILDFFGIMTFLQALAHPYFKGLAKVEREPSCQPITKMEFEFERRRVTKEDIRELIFREILEYHPQLLKDYINGTERTTFLYPRLYHLYSWTFTWCFCIHVFLYWLSIPTTVPPV